MAESITEGTLKQWSKQVGDFVERDEEIATIETDKIDVAVNAPDSGTIKEFLAKEDDTVTVGQDLVKLELGGSPQDGGGGGEMAQQEPKSPASDKQATSSDPEPKKDESTHDESPPPQQEKKPEPPRTGPSRKESPPPPPPPSETKKPEPKPSESKISSTEGPSGNREERRVSSVDFIETNTVD